jgi:hypothetical protein
VCLGAILSDAALGLLAVYSVFLVSARLPEAVQDVVFVAMTSFSAGSPMRFAKKPARISPKLPVGTTKRTVDAGRKEDDLIRSKYE